MNIPVRIGMDTSKSVFQLHGVDENERIRSAAGERLIGSALACIWITSPIPESP